jgi:Fic family protein
MTRAAFRPDRPFNELPHLPPVPGTSLHNVATGAPVYTPPESEARLRDLLANWELFLHDATDLDPLVRLTVGHYQFEAIHPFEDGNGRTGRILNLLVLVEQRLLASPVLYLSRAIIRTKADYYRLLLQVTTDGGWQEWVLYMLQAVDETARWTTAKVLAMRELLRRTSAFVKSQAPKIYSRELVDVIFAQPYARIANVVAAGIAKRETASIYLTRLAQIGVLTPVPAGRDKLFVHRRLLDLLMSETHEVPKYL